MRWILALGVGFQSAPISHGWLKSQTAHERPGHVPDPRLLELDADALAGLERSESWQWTAFPQRSDARGPLEQCVLALGQSVNEPVRGLTRSGFGDRQSHRCPLAVDSRP